MNMFLIFISTKRLGVGYVIPVIKIENYPKSI